MLRASKGRQRRHQAEPEPSSAGDRHTTRDPGARQILHSCLWALAAFDLVPADPAAPPARRRSRCPA
eukprot:3464163-Lingulodinium_polyedra.AAC.1